MKLGGFSPVSRAELLTSNFFFFFHFTGFKQEASSEGFQAQESLGGSGQDGEMVNGTGSFYT